MIPEFNLRPLHNGEFLTFTKQVLKITDDPVLPRTVVSVRADLQLYYDRIEKAHVLEDDSEINKERRAIDAARDVQWSGLSQLAKAFATNPVPEKAAAGSRLATRMADYGTVEEVTDGGDADESADITGLLRDLQQPEYAAAVTLIGAGDWVAELTRLQALFESKSNQRNRERTERQQERPENIDALRLKATNAYRELYRKVNSFYIAEEGAAPWQRITSEWTTLVADTRNLLKSRRGRAAAASTPPTA
ncbi:hypothetical protein EPD60_06540 [Flaviaesturariibacter flavus]|uniref:Uncharacterized protein n=1 Tax=Flaviaesturariibacter flavus TaxID=2502780 RepID=A0A4R1BKM2_9BACT|nr:DUF6261 family protein [Flaviaesturariibacter flavus]TCJ17837.1 hypothetical protein EPD60_06540 [Flaviaesturariibacter flavus]